MPRPRFAKLEPDKQAGILSVAASEFAENGFEGASYNRIIEQAGLSKGAMYYYFDDKTDLYVTVLKDAIDRMMAATLEGIEDAGGYWAQFEHMFKQSVAFTLEHPEFGALVRGLLDAPARLRAAGGPIEKLYASYRQQTVELIQAGQAQGEVRTDLPLELIVGVMFGMGEAVDRWWIENLETIGDDTDRWARELIGLFRRVAEPRGDES